MHGGLSSYSLDHKTGFKVHYAITLKSRGPVIEIFKYTKKPWLEEASDCINNRQEDRVREKKSLEEPLTPG